MAEPIPRMQRYESEYARQKREQAERKSQPADLLAVLALENCGAPVQHYQPQPGEIDRGSYQHRLDELRNRMKKSQPIKPSYLDDGWC